ncbi:MAG: enoyl-CoA hydratase/isomerase family protein [Bdellovibrionota bacterium]
MALVLFEENPKGWAKITLNDPDNLNAMSEDMAAEFSALVARLMPDKEKYRAIILTGAGRAFSAGGDLQMLEKKIEFSAEKNKELMLKFYNSFLSILDLEVPIVAAINGHAIGAGLCVASACDIRISSDSAKLGFTFTKLGLHPGMGATYFLPKVVGYAVASELMLTGRVIKADEAQRIGLVSQVVETDKVMETAEGIVSEILSCGPLATRQLLANLRGGAKDMKASLEAEADAQAVNYHSADFKEGVRSVIEKRPANF